MLVCSHITIVLSSPPLRVFSEIGKVQVFVEAASSTALSVGWSSTHTDAVVRITATP